MNSLQIFIQAHKLPSAVIGACLGLVLYLGAITYIQPHIPLRDDQGEPKRVDCYIDGDLYMLTPDDCKIMTEKILARNQVITISPSISIQIPKLTSSPSDPDPVISCRGTKGSRCESQSILVRGSVCRSGTYVCCQIGNTWSLQEKSICNDLQKDQDVSYTSITLPHNGKQYRCKTGVEDDIYNQSLEIKKLKDLYNSEITKLNEYEDRNCHTGYEESDNVCQDYVNKSKEGAINIFLGGADKNEKILNANISKACQ